MADTYQKDSEQDDKAETSRKEEVLRVARERRKQAIDYWSPIYSEAQEDIRFLSGDQWDEADKESRKREGRPCLTVNRLPQFARQIINDQKQNRPSIKVSPVDDKGDAEIARIRQGLIRNIEVKSKASSAYDRAFEGAVQGGFGFYRIRTDYVSPQSFDQELIIDRINDQFKVKIDPWIKEIDGSDMNWGFIESEVSKDDYCEQYPDSKLSEKGADWADFSDRYAGWVTDNSALICEYYCKEYKTKELVQLKTGEVFERSELPEVLPAGVEIVASKKASVPVIKHYKLSGVDILEESIFPGVYIPILPVFGSEIIVDGKRILESVIRHAKDPQRMHNYWVSCETESIALAPKAPFLAAEGQIPKEYEQMWANANRRTQAYLVYKPVSLGGQVLGAPQRNVYEPPVQAITNARLQSSDDLKATTGMYDAALGARSNEQSGRAIERRTAQAQTSNYHFVDNLHASLRHCGRILNGAIPVVYDTARTARIIGDEGNEEVVKLNQPFVYKGEEKTIDLSVGDYDVVVEAGPSFATKRQEAVNTMLELTRAYPQLGQIALDLMVKNMDLPGGSELAERIKKTLPPGLADSGDEEQKPIPPEIQAQLKQQDELVQQLTEKLNQATDVIKIKANELESRERIEMAKLENQATIELAKLESKESLQLLSQQISQLEGRLVGLDYGQDFDQNFNEPPPDQQQFDQQQLTGESSPGPIMEGP